MSERPHKTVKRSAAARLAAVLLLGLSVCVASAQGQEVPPESLQLNVTYFCPAGITYIITKCSGSGYKEICTWREEQNGHLVTEANSQRANMGGRFAQCKPGAPNAQAGRSAVGGLQVDTPYRCADGSSLTAFACERQNGKEYCTVRLEQNSRFVTQAPKPREEIVEKLKTCQAQAPFNPAYLAEFPTSDYVIMAMNVGNPRDNLLRAIGAFYQLSEIIKALSGIRESGAYLPDEKKLLDQYSHFASVLAEAGRKNFPGQQFSPETNPYRFSRRDPKFGFAGIPVWNALLPPVLQARFAQTVGGGDPRYLAQVEQEKRAATQRVNAEVAEAKAKAELKAMPNDAGSVALRKCLESGRSQMECLGEGLTKGFGDYFGMPQLVADTSPKGLRMGGIYSAGNLSIDFRGSQAVVSCGTLRPQGTPYTVEKAGNQVVVHLSTAPKPITLALRADGRLAGPGPVTIAGLVPAGGGAPASAAGASGESHTTTTQQQISAAEVPNHALGEVHQNGMEYSVDQQVTSSSEPAFTPHSVPMVQKTERCDASLLAATGSTLRASDVLTQTLGSDPGKVAKSAPGLRLSGTYATSGGLSIEFRDDSATLGCGEAHAAQAYTVRDSGGQITVAVQNGSAPFTLAVQPNGTLMGSGRVQVNGRVISGHRGNEILYAPRTASCTVGTMSLANAGK